MANIHNFPLKKGPSSKPMLTFSMKDNNHIHTQLNPATLWIITHSLKKFPTVQTIISEGNVITGAVRHLSENSLQITFSEAISGIAICN